MENSLSQMSNIKTYDARQQSEPVNGRRPYTLAAAVERMLNELEEGKPNAVRIIDPSGRVAVAWALWHYVKDKPYKIKTRKMDDVYFISKI